MTAVLKITEQVRSSRTPRTGEILLEKGLITKDQLSLCLNAQFSLQSMGLQSRIGNLILDFGFANQTEVEAAITETGQVSGGIGTFSFPMSLLKRIKAYPVSLRGGVLRVAASGRLDKVDILDIIAAATDSGLSVSDVEIIPTDRMEVLQSIGSMMTPDRATVAAELAEMPLKIDDSAFISQVINHIFIDAIQSRASDIHLTVLTGNSQRNWITYRIDGKPSYAHLIAPEAMAVLATRIKSDAGLDSSDTMRPHDGSSSIRYGDKQIDIRVSTLPITDMGETIVLRLQDSSTTPSLKRLFDIHPVINKSLHHLVLEEDKNGGIFLVTGPTGSGKTTTLNAFLRGIDRSRRIVKTVEDPVEMKIPFVGQTQVNEAAGLTYAKVLRALLRQDPDVIMVGELRDEETVETALRGAETGHMMLSTLHTGSVAESVTRLLGMMKPGAHNIGKYIIAGKLKGVINQRLAKRLCSKCVQESDPDRRYLDLLKQTVGESSAAYLPTVFYSATGCDRCDHTGHYGRVIIPEALFIDGNQETRDQFESILIENRPFREVFKLPGVVHYSKKRAVIAALVSGDIDVSTGLSLLEVHHKEMAI